MSTHPAAVVARDTLERILESDYAIHPEYLAILQAGITRQQAVLEEKYVVAIDTDLTQLPSVEAFAGQGGRIYLGGHHVIYAVGEQRTVMRARPHLLRVLIDRDGTHTEEDFALSRSEVQDALGARTMIACAIRHQKGTGTPQQFSVRYQPLREAIEAAMDRFP